MKPAPHWLADFQARFGQTLRVPLDRTTGTLTAVPSSYDAALARDVRATTRAAAEERLATYNRQYWFRLFGVLQQAFPLAARVLGHWTFNDLAARFLALHPPGGWDLDAVPAPFESFLARTVTEERLAAPSRSGFVERDAILESAALDAAWQRVFTAPEVTPFRPGPEDAARLPEARLTASPAVAVLRETWPLLELRRRVLTVSAEHPVPLPPRHPEPQWWALVRTPSGIGQLALARGEATLFVLLGAHPVGVALGMLESTCPLGERATLPADARRWLARSVELGFWTGLEPA